MTLTDISICSDALIKIGANPIASFEEGSAEAEVAVNTYETVKKSMLSSHTWNFAIKKTKLNMLSDNPTTDYSRAFLLPNDLLRVISAGASAAKGLNYSIVGNQLHTNSENVSISYIANIKEEFFPAFFVPALVYKLAFEFSIPVTENTSKANFFANLAEIELRKAKLIDAQEETPKAIEDYTLVNVRY